MGAREIIRQAESVGLDPQVAARLQTALVPAMDEFLARAPDDPPEPGDDTELIAALLDVFATCASDLIGAMPALAASAASSLDQLFEGPEFSSPSRALPIRRLREAVQTLEQLFSAAWQDVSLPDDPDELAFPELEELREMPAGMLGYFRVLMLVVVGLERATEPLERFAGWAWLAAVEASRLKPFVAKFALALRRPFRTQGDNLDMRTTARYLAREHRLSDSEISEILMVPPAGDDEIRLLEVTGSVGTTNEIVPITFGAKPEKGLNFAMSVILVSEEEREALEAGELELPDDWGAIGDLEKIEDEDGEERSRPD